MEDPNFRCRRCLGNTQAIDGKPCAEVQLVVGNFVYLGDGNCLDGGCDLAIIKRCCSAWRKFR